MEFSFKVMSIMALWCSSYTMNIVLLRPPELDDFFIKLKSEMDSTAAATDPIPNMDTLQRISLCADVSHARLYLTEDDYKNPLPFINYESPYLLEKSEREYKERTVSVANTPVPVKLLSCSDDSRVFVAYGFTNHYYFVFTKATGDSDIRLLAIAEPLPNRNELSRDFKNLYSTFWENIKGLNVSTWMEKIMKFRLLSKGQQFRLCGLAYESCVRFQQNPRIYSIRMHDSTEGEEFLRTRYSEIFYYTPGSPCNILDGVDDSRPKFYIVPNPSDDHSVYLSVLVDSDVLPNNAHHKDRMLTRHLTKVSPLYKNEERFEDLDDGH